MTTNILSENWPSATADLAQLVQSGRVNKPKQTPAQRRKAVYEELISALTNGEHEAVKEIISDNADVKLNEAGWENLASTALKFFDFDIVRLLHEKGLPLSPSFIARSLQKEFSSQVFDYFCTSQHLYANEQGSYKARLLEMYRMALCGYAVSHERLRTQYRHVREQIQAKYPNWATETRQKMDLADYNWREAVERFPFKYPTKLSASDAHFFNSLSQKEVEHILTRVGEKDKMTTSELESLNRFICADPKRLEFWTRQEKQRHNDRATYRQQWAQWGLEGAFDWADTKVPELIESTRQQIAPDLTNNFSMYLKYSFECFSQTWNYIENQQRFFLQKGYIPGITLDCLQGKASICHEDLDVLLGWDLLDAVLLEPSTTQLMMMNNTVKDQNIIFNSMTVAAPSLLHNLVSTGAPAVGSLLKNPNGAQLVNDILLEDKALLILWCKNTALSAFSELVSSLPQWKEWMDSHGNNLGHYIIASRAPSNSDITPSMLSALSKINPDWLTASNNQGLTVSQIAQNSDFREDAKIWLGKHIIAQSVKSELNTAHIKPKTQKRRM